MIDLHTHVLPGLDDGARTLEESVAMIRVAAGTGTTDLVASPHASLDYAFDRGLAAARLAEVAQASGELVRLHLGCDFHLSFDNIQAALANPRWYTICGNAYLLVEFPDVMIASTTDEVFRRFREEAGIVPIVTHPERNFLLHTRLPQLRSWVESGCLLQVTAQSLLGRFGPQVRRFSEKLMKENLVQVIASDAHDPEDRPPRLDLAYQHVARKYGEARARRLFVTNPRAVLCGQPLPEEEEPEPPPRRKWYRFW